MSPTSYQTAPPRGEALRIPPSAAYLARAALTHQKPPRSPIRCLTKESPLRGGDPRPGGGQGLRLRDGAFDEPTPGRDQEESGRLQAGHQERQDPDPR